MNVGQRENMYNTESEISDADDDDYRFIINSNSVVCLTNQESAVCYTSHNGHFREGGKKIYSFDYYNNNVIQLI